MSLIPLPLMLTLHQEQEIIIGAILLTKIQTLFKFHFFFTYFFSVPESYSRSHSVILFSFFLPLFSLLQFATVLHSFSFMTLRLWKNTNWSFCKMPLSLVHQIFSYAWRVLVILGCCNKNTRLDGLHYVNLFLIDLEARNPRSRF